MPMLAAVIALFDATTSGIASGVSGIQMFIAIAAPVVLLGLAWWTTVRGKDPKKDTGLFVGFIAYFAIVCGACFIAVSTRHWPAIFLIAGGCLGAGFIFGLLFGYPLSDGKKKTKGGQADGGAAGGVNQAGANAAAGGGKQAPANAASQTAPVSRNLMQQSADSLSKVIAGATLVQYQKIAVEFKRVSWSISQCAGECCNKSDKAFGAGVTLYFFALGFLIGLFLLPLYNLEPGDHSDHLDDDGDGNGKGAVDGKGNAAPPAQVAGGPG